MTGRRHIATNTGASSCGSVSQPPHPSPRLDDSPTWLDGGDGAGGVLLALEAGGAIHPNVLGSLVGE